MPHLLRLADARHGRLPRTPSGGGDGPGAGLPRRARGLAGAQPGGRGDYFGSEAPIGHRPPPAVLLRDRRAGGAQSRPGGKTPSRTAPFPRGNPHHLPGARPHARSGAPGAQTGRHRSAAPHRRTDRRHPATGRLAPRRGSPAALGGATYLDRGYVAAVPIGPNGLWARLYVAMRSAEQQTHAEFAGLLVDTAFATLTGVERIGA